MSRICSFVFLLLAWLLAACEKPILSDEPVPEGNVTLRFSLYEQVPFSTRSVSDVTQLCTRLNVAFFQDGTKVKSVSQKTGDASFGKVSLKLDEGDYQVVVIAHNSDGSATITSEDKVTFPSNVVSDTFYYYGTLSVSASASTYDLELTRIVAMFRLELTTPLPAEVNRLRFQYTGGSSTFSPLSGFGSVNSRQTVWLNVAAGQRMYEIYTIPHAESGELKITATAYDASDNEVKQQVFEKVPVTRNQITVYSGDFLTGNSGKEQGFNLAGEYDWQATQRYTF